MNKVFYTSDLHIGHRLVSHIRGFGDSRDTADTAAHDEWLRDLWDSTVRPDDVVWILGDIAVGGFPYALEWLRQRPGIKHLISGNHDPVHPANSKSEKELVKWQALGVFETIQPFTRRKLTGKTVLLSHFPYWSYGDGDRPEIPEPRFQQYRLVELDDPLLHGHTHGPEQIHDKMFHVGLDAWNRFITQEEIMEWLETL